jgi:hypothetical protein
MDDWQKYRRNMYARGKDVEEGARQRQRAALFDFQSRRRPRDAHDSDVEASWPIW